VIISLAGIGKFAEPDHRRSVPGSGGRRLIGERYLIGGAPGESEDAGNEQCANEHGV
jgi:hypothetical protein